MTLEELVAVTVTQRRHLVIEVRPIEMHGEVAFYIRLDAGYGPGGRGEPVTFTRAFDSREPEEYIVRVLLSRVGPEFHRALRRVKFSDLLKERGVSSMEELIRKDLEEGKAP